MNLLNVDEWDKDIPYRAYDVVCIEWTCMGFLKRAEYYVALIGSEENLNVNRNPISFPAYWQLLKIQK